MKTLIFIDDERNFEDVTWVSYPHFDKVVTLRQYHELENLEQVILFTRLGMLERIGRLLRSTLIFTLHGSLCYNVAIVKRTRY